MSSQDKSEPASFSRAVLDWFQKHGRKNLPWQKNPNPYRVWVSEIMLQQTQVATVIPYYEKFIESFPEVSDLALASEDTVLHHWTGLGYYARARNLHKTAKIIHHEKQNIFPDSVEQLIELPGIGRSTAGAMIALANDQHAAILDGNVKRVLSRYHCVEGWAGQSNTLKQLWQLAEMYTPADHCRSYTQAMMDLGATICTRSKPTCSICPLQQNCQAYQEQKIEDFPEKKPKKKLPVKAIQMLILKNKNGQKVLLEKRPSQGIWGGLWSFPEIEINNDASSFLQTHGFTIQNKPMNWDRLRHTFSHFHLDIHPQVLRLDYEPSMLMEKQDWHWYDLSSPTELGLAAPVKTLLKKLSQEL
jgi:A/G-specific adenine glycosylase